jgi:outer membrane protein TolC
MQKYRILIALFLGSAFIQGAEAPAPPARTLSLEDCIKVALEHNLDVQIQRINPILARYNVSLAYAGYDPTFSISGTHNFSMTGGGLNADKLATPNSMSDANSFSAGLNGLLPTGLTYSLGGNVSESYGNSGFSGPFDNTSGGASIRLTQPLLKNAWIDGTRMNIQVSKNSVKSTDLTVRLQVMTTVTSVEQAYYDLIFARESVKVQEKALQLSERLLAENKKRVEVGSMAPLDEKQAESQVAANRAALLATQQSLSSQQNALKKLLSDNYSSWQEINIEPTESLSAPAQLFSLQDSWQRGLNQRPELLQMKIDLQRQDIVLKYNRNQLFPELDLVGSYGHSASSREFSGAFGELSEGNKPNYAYGAQLSIPLSNRSARYNYKINQAKKQQTLLQLKQLEQNIMVQIDDAVKLAQTSYQRVDATKQARLYAEAALDAEQKKYESGKSTSFYVLQFQRDLTGARSDEIRALADYNKALASLALAEGSTLDRQHLNIETK